MTGRCAALSIVLVLVGLGRAGADQTPPSPPQPGRLLIHAVAAATGAPLEGVSVDCRRWAEGKPSNSKLVTDKEGTAVYEWQPRAPIGRLTLTARKPGYAPIHIQWDDGAHPIELPAAKELRLEPATPVGGVIKDETGRPVTGAQVQVMAPATESMLSNYVFTVGSAKTDAAGRWRVDDGPANLASAFLSVTHPDFRRGGGRPSHDLDSTVVLTRGLTLQGRVLDSGGHPIKNAQAVLGHDIWGTNPPRATSGDDGTFVLRNCAAGASIVTVQADGFAPQIQDVRVENETPPVAFRLEPAATIRFRVVDAAGNPLAGVDVAADTWRGHRSLTYRKVTDADGRLTWPSAPADAVVFHLLKEGYMSVRDASVMASDQEQQITLPPKLVVAGRVTDAATGQPINAFTVIQGRQFQGRDHIYWERGEGGEIRGGRYTTTFGEPSAALFVRIEATGFKPADSRAFKPGEGVQTHDFALHPAGGLAGVVVGPGGRPTAGVEVALATEENRAMLRMGRLDRNVNLPRTTTGPDGRFTFAAPDAPYLLIALGDAGFAEATADEFKANGQLVLQTWGTIEGRALIGRGPAANQEITFHPKRPERGNVLYVFDYGYTTDTGAEGRFRFDRVVPGPGEVSRVVVTQFAGGSSQHMGCWQEPVEVPAGGSVHVTIGGRGRPVVGSIVLGGTPERPIDWLQNEPAQIMLPQGKLGEGPRGWDRYAGNLQKDGRFRIDDVPPGRYQLVVPVNVPPDPRFCGAGTEIGRATVEVTVPEGPDDAAVDIGAVTAELYATIKPGDRAPEFAAERIDGTIGQLRLADHAGKLVLLDFWATWCGPCLAEMPAMKDLRAAFAADPRLVVVGLSCDQEPDAPRRYIQENGLDWPQAFAGSMHSGLPETYKVRAIPATFLIAPDGRVLAKNLRGAELKQAVAAALKDGALFATDRKPAAAPSSSPR
jgi:peroxiredoxin/protocatechuate 3,4-dioxygenase beta subunit